MQSTIYNMLHFLKRDSPFISAFYPLWSFSSNSGKWAQTWGGGKSWGLPTPQRQSGVTFLNCLITWFFKPLGDTEQKVLCPRFSQQVRNTATTVSRLKFYGNGYYPSVSAVIVKIVKVHLNLLRILLVNIYELLSAWRKRLNSYFFSINYCNFWSVLLSTPSPWTETSFSFYDHQSTTCK